MNYFGIINSMNKLDGNAATFLSTASITDQIIVQAINNLVKDLKTTGLWSNFIAIYPFVGGNATAHRYNLADTSQYNLIFNGGWTHSSTGALPNGTNAFANTAINANAKLTQNNTHLAFYSRTAAAAADRVSMGAIVGSSSPMVGIQFRNAAGNAVAQNASGTANQTAVTANSDSSGFFIGNKTSSAIGGLSMIRNGVTLASNVAAITTNNFPNANILISAYTATTFFDNKQVAFASVGLGFTSPQIATLNTIVTNFQIALSRNV